MHLDIVTRQPEANLHQTPLLFVHGAWHGVWCWTEQFLPYFAQYGYISHALDLRGHGNSEGRYRLRWTSITEYVSDVAQVASQLARPPVLIGHSMGGLVVQKYVESHQAPSAVLLASATLPEGQPDPETLSYSQYTRPDTRSVFLGRYARREAASLFRSYTK